ncbi:hypothetical protein ABLE91_12545 [Aquabacter sp. CN5-332]|uniref:hypothetical protein n=1 Tax=Aquabacter sp. CN5-332 TaxID=3156608 RepID=UPI0032B35EFA
MHFFNLDLHIAIISDIKRIFATLGHEVTDWTLSGHAWVLGRERDKVDVINHLNWRSIDRAMCDAFYDRYKDELARYDGFIVTHSPCFAMLYERWNKPIITIASTRYEHPFTDQPEKWRAFNGFLQRGIDSGLIIPLSNNRYDAAYAEAFTGRSWPTISNYCDYTGASYQPGSDTFLYWSKFKQQELPPHMLDKDRLKPNRFRRLLNRVPFLPREHGFGWEAIGTYRGIVHIPYNASVMSIFEQYAAGIPLFFPSFEFLMDLYGAHGDAGVLSEISFNQVLKLESGSSIMAAPLDPNDFKNPDSVSHWLRFADFYQTDIMPHLVYFDSFDHLRTVLRDTDLDGVSTRMSAHNARRKQIISSQWADLLSKIEGRATSS